MQTLKRNLPLISLAGLCIALIAATLLHFNGFEWTSGWLSFFMYLFAGLYITTRRDNLWEMNITRGFLLLFVALPVIYFCYLTACLARGLLPFELYTWITLVIPLLLTLIIGLVIFFLPADGRPINRIIPLKAWLFRAAVSVLCGVLAGLVVRPLQIQIHAYSQFIYPVNVIFVFGFAWALLIKRTKFAVALPVSALLFMLTDTALSRYSFPLGILMSLALGLLLGVILHKGKSLTYPTLAYLIFIFINFN